MSDSKATTAAAERPEFLNQRKTVDRLHRLLEEAAKKVWLVSPYVRFDQLRELRRKVITTRQRGVEVTLVIRAPDKSTRYGAPDVEALQKLVEGGVKLRVIPDLHAKLYVSERHALVTSLNLLESSINNSIEIGHWVPAGTEGFAELQDYFKRELALHLSDVAPDRLIPLQAEARAKAAKDKASGKSQEAADTASESKARQPAKKEKQASSGPRSGKGYCIACGDRIALDPDYPYCKDCYAESDDGDVESQCHDCGKDARTTLEKPLCKACHRVWSEGDDAPF